MMENVENEEGLIYTAVFPEEVWKIILSNLRGTHQDLLRCRLVCYGFKCLAEEVLQEHNSLWVPTFPGSYDEFQRQVHGTRLSSAEQVTTFISDVEGNFSGNPFPNGTVMFAPVTFQNQILEPEQRKRFYESFPSLVSQYGEEITSLVYYFNEVDDDKEFFNQLETICKLPNLTRLALFKLNWNFHSTSTEIGEMLEELKRKEGFQVPEKVIELQILGQFGFVPLAFVFSRLSPIMQSVTQLYFSFSWYCTRYMTPRASREYRQHLRMPKLERLKLWDPNRAIFDYFCQPSIQLLPTSSLSPLKEISIKFPTQNQLPPGFPIEGRLAQILTSMDNHAETLRLFHLDIDEKVLKLRANPKLDPPLNRGVTYPKMKYLSIQFFTVFCWKSLMEEFKEKYPALEELTVLIHREDIEGKPAIVLYDFMAELWDRFAPSLKVIRVPFYGWNLKRGETPSLS